MAGKPKGPLENFYQNFVVKDFSAGMVVQTGQLSIPQNGAQKLLNCFPAGPGRLQYRGGWTIYGQFPNVADQAYSFYDSNGNKHLPVWQGGTLVDMVTGGPIAVDAGAYTPGQQVGVVDLNGILYWSTKTVPIRYWNPATNTVGTVPQNGISPTPCSPYLTLYTNAIVACGVKFGSGAYQPNVFSWSDINDPTTWNAANSQDVGPNNGFGISFATPFGIAEIGVSPFRTIIVGRSDKGIYAYQGALGSLQEILINCPVGCLDGASVQYLPSAGSFGTLVFLGTDAQIWATNGITAAPVSDAILPLLSQQVISTLNIGGNQRFFSGFNEIWQYYFVNVGGTQFVYKWDFNAWAIFVGWPTGPYITSTDINGVPTLFCASQQEYTTNPAGNFVLDVSRLDSSATLGSGGTGYVLAEIALDQTTDNGIANLVQYVSPYFDMGDPNLFKHFDWASQYTYNTGTDYQLTSQTMPRANGTFLQSNPLVFNAPPFNAPKPPLFTLDVSALDGPAVLAGPNVGEVGSGIPVIAQGRLAAVTTPSGMLAGRAPTFTSAMRGHAISVTVAYNGGTMDFELVGVEIRWKAMKGYLRDGNQGYNPEGGINNPSPYLVGFPQ